MSKEENQSRPTDGSDQQWTEAESSLGQAMVLLSRISARLDDTVQAEQVQKAFRRAAVLLENARATHERVVASLQISVGGQGNVPSETVAIIAAAIAAVLEGPYQILSVKPVPSPAPHVNVWALEGRTQIFQSHRIR